MNFKDLYEDENGSVANLGEQPTPKVDDELVVEGMGCSDDDMNEDEQEGKVDDELMLEDEDEEDKDKKDEEDKKEDETEFMDEGGIEDAIRDNPPGDPDSKIGNYVKDNMEEEDEDGIVLPPGAEDVCDDLAVAIVAAMHDIMGDPAPEPEAPHVEPDGDEMPAAPQEEEPMADDMPMPPPEDEAPVAPPSDEQPSEAPDEVPAPEPGDDEGSGGEDKTQVVDLQNQVSDLEAENQALRDRIKELEGQE